MTRIKHLQNSLRVLLVAGSVSGFMGGWVLLAHAGKPAQPGADTLPPPAAITMPAPSNLPSFVLPPSSSQSSSNLQALPQPRVRSFSGRLRSGGS